MTSSQVQSIVTCKPQDLVDDGEVLEQLPGHQVSMSLLSTQSLKCLTYAEPNNILLQP
jgi:hypothetical protein